VRQSSNETIQVNGFDQDWLGSTSVFILPRK